MRTMQHSLKQPDISAKIMRKKKITTSPDIQNTPLVPILAKINNNVQKHNAKARPCAIHVTNAKNLF